MFSFFKQKKFVTVIAKFRFQNLEFKNEFIKLLKGPNGLVKTRKFKGCIGIKILQFIHDESSIVIYQKWNSIEHHKEYLKWRQNDGLGDFLKDKLDEPLIPVYFEYLPKI